TATCAWSRTMTGGATARYFWSIVTASKLTPTRHLLSKHRADMSEPQVRFGGRQQSRFKLFPQGEIEIYLAAISVRPFEDTPEGQAEHGGEPEQGLRQDRGLA